MHPVIAMIAARLPQADFLTMQIGAVLGVHIGIGGVGVFFFRRKWTCIMASRGQSGLSAVSDELLIEKIY